MFRDIRCKEAVAFWPKGYLKRKTGKTERKNDGTFDESKTEKNDGNAKHLTDQELFGLKSFVIEKL